MVGARMMEGGGPAIMESLEHITVNSQVGEGRRGRRGGEEEEKKKRKVKDQKHNCNVEIKNEWGGEIIIK